MSLFCRVRYEDDVIRLVKANATKWGVEDPLGLLEGIRKGWIFYTEGWEDVLQPIWQMHVARTSGNLTEKSPLLDESGKQPHCWREGRRGQGRPHIYLPGKPGDPREKEEGFVAHRWVQAQLVNLGLDLDEEVKMEHTIPGGVIDVAWFGSKIAWEVDLTQQTLSGQQVREERRKAAGFDMIAVQDSAEAKESVLGVATMTVYKLKQAANKRQDARYPFKRMLVDSAFELDPTVPNAEWRERKRLQIESFCRQLKRKQWYYATFAAENRPTAYAWVQHSEVEAFKKKQAAYEAQLEKERLAKEARAAQEALENAEKAARQRREALEKAQNAEAELAKLKEDLERLDIADGERRVHFVKGRPSRPKASGDLEATMNQLENMIGNYENGGKVWRALDRVLGGFMGRARKRRVVALEMTESQLAQNRERIERRKTKLGEAETHLEALRSVAASKSSAGAKTG